MAVRKSILKKKQPDVAPAIVRATGQSPTPTVPGPEPEPLVIPAPTFIPPAPLPPLALTPPTFIPPARWPEPEPTPAPAPMVADVDPSVVRAAQLPENQPVPPAPLDDESARYYEAQPNPPFIAVRGGPAMPGAPAGSVTQRPSAALADYLQNAGVHPELADEYRQGPVDFSPLDGWKGGAVIGQARGAGGIALPNFLQGLSEPDVIRTAQHEAIHQRGPSNTQVPPSFLEAVAQAEQEAPGYFARIRALPAYQNQPDLEHDFTGPFDAGMTLEDIPQPLKRFYVDAEGNSLLRRHDLPDEVDPAIRRASITPAPHPRTYRNDDGTSSTPEEVSQRYHDQFSVMPEIAGAPRLFVHDPSGPNGGAVRSPSAAQIAVRSYAAPLAEALRVVHDELLRDLTRQVPDLEPSEFRGLTMDDQGGAINQPMGDLQKDWLNQVLANPHSDLQRIMRQHGDTPATLNILADKLVSDMLHELAHQRAWGHGPDFSETEADFANRTSPLRSALTWHVERTLRGLREQDGGAAWQEFVADAMSQPLPFPDETASNSLLTRPTYPTAGGAQDFPHGLLAQAPDITGPDFSAITENPIVQAAGEVLGAGIEAAGRMPLTPIPGSPTVGDVAGPALGALQAAGEVGAGVARLGGIGFTGIPGSTAPRTPAAVAAEARARIGQGIAARTPTNPVEFLAAAVEAVREYQQHRPAAFPGEKVLSEALFDASNLLPGIGIGDDVIKALTKSKLWEGVRQAGGRAAAGVAEAVQDFPYGRHVGALGDAGETARLEQAAQEATERAKAAATPQPPNQYDPLSDPARADEARALVAADPQAAKAQVFASADPPDGLTRAAGHLLIEQAQAAGDSAAAITTATKITERALAAGDVEGLTALGKLTPDNVVQLAQDTVKQAQEAGARSARLTPQREAKLRAQAAKINAMPEGRAKVLATAVLARDITEAVPPHYARKTGTLHVAAQLLNPKTVIRNIGGNAIFAGFENVTRLMATGLDIGLARFGTGQRSVTAPDLWAQLRGLARGAVEGTQDAIRGVNTSGAATGAKFELGRGRTFRSGIPEVMEAGLTPTERAARILGMPAHYAEVALNLALQMPDRAFYQAAFDDDLLRIAKVQAINEGLTGQARAQRAAQLLAQPTRAMIEEAQATALFRTFNNESMAATLASGIKKGFNIAGIGPRNKSAGLLSLDRYAGQFGVGDFVIKYPKLPANLLMRAVDYSPIGFLNAAAAIARPLLNSTRPFNQRAFVEAVSRATIGTAGLTAGGQYLSHLGLITGQGPTHYEASVLHRQQGLTPYRINITAFRRWVLSGFDRKAARKQDGDRWVSYGWAAPMALPIAFGANMSEARRSGPRPLPTDPSIKRAAGKPEHRGSIFDQLSQAATAGNDALRLGWDLFSDQGVAQGVVDLTNDVYGAATGAEGNHTDTLVRLLQSAPASFVPTLLSQVDQLLDNAVRDRYDPDVWKGAANGVLAKIPVLAATLPARRDVFGEQLQRFPEGNDPWAVLLNPSDTARYLPSPAARMILELEAVTGLGDHMPPVAPRRIYVGSKVYELTAEQTQEYQRVLGAKVNEAFTRLAELPEFRAKPEAEQVEFLARVARDAEAQAYAELRARGREAGGGVSPQGNPWPRRDLYNSGLTGKVAAEYVKAEKHLKRYDEVPELVQQTFPAYAELGRRHAEAVANKDIAARATIENSPLWDQYQAAVRQHRTWLRRNDADVEQAVTQFRALAPIGTRGADVQSVVPPDATLTPRPLAPPYATPPPAPAPTTTPQARPAAPGTPTPTATPSPTPTATLPPQPTATPTKEPTPTRTPDPANTPRPGATQTIDFTRDVLARQASAAWGRTTQTGAALTYDQFSAAERRAIDTHLANLNMVAAELYGPGRQWRSLNPGQQTQVETVTRQRYGGLLPPGTPTPRVGR